MKRASTSSLRSGVEALVSLGCTPCEQTRLMDLGMIPLPFDSLWADGLL